MLKQMRHFCAVCSLAVVLCLVVCVSANPEVTKAEAEREVTGAKETATRVLKNAQNELKKANGFVQRVELLKSEATQALSQAEKAPKDNKEAVDTADNIKSSLEGFELYYSEAKKILDDAISSLTLLLEEADKLEGDSKIQIPNDGSTTDYTKTKGKATTVKVEAEDLERRIAAESRVVGRVDTKANDMADYVKDAKYESLHLSVIVAVAEIDTIIKDTGNHIKETQNKKNEVSRIVEKMQNRKTNVPSGLTTLIDELCNSANEALRNATEAVQKATKAKTNIPQHKKTAAAILTNFRLTQDVTKAQRDAQNTEASVNAIKEIVLLLQSALQTANDSVTNAKLAHDKMVEALANIPSEQHTQQTKGKEEGNLSVVGGTVPDQKDARIQPIAINTEQKEGKELLCQSKQNSENPVEDTTEIYKRSTTVKTTAINIEKTIIETSDNSLRQTSDQPATVHSDQPKKKIQRYLKKNYSKVCRMKQIFHLPAERHRPWVPRMTAQ